MKIPSIMRTRWTYIKSSWC